MSENNDGKKPEKSANQSSKSITRSFLLSFILFIVFSIGTIPLVLTLKIVLYFYNLDNLLFFLISPFVIFLEIFIFIVSEILISGAIIRLFNIRYKEGTYEYSLKNKMAFRWMLICQLYTPCKKILEIVPMGHIKIFYLKLLGMKIGENTLIGAMPKDPCVTEVGENTTIGEYAIIYGHIHNYAKGTIAIKKVKIGDKCVVGSGAIIMPGVVMEDSSVVGAGGLVSKNRLLEKGKVYGGNPAKEIPNTEKSKN